MSKTSCYIAFSVAGLALGISGCGSTQKICPPVVAPNANAGTNAAGDASVKGRANPGANAGTNAATTAPPTDAELREAADLRARAQTHVDASRLREALPDLERAFSLSRDVTLLGDLGLAFDAVGRFDESWLALYRFRAEANTAYEPVRAKIDAKLEELEKQLGGLVIDTDTPGAELIIRGQVVAKLPLATPIFLAPGRVSVLVRAAGKPDFTLRSRVTSGAIARASANLAKVAAGPMGGVGSFTPPAPPSPPIWPIVVIGGGAVVLGGAMAAGIIYSGKVDQFELNHCGKADAKPICKSLDSDANISMLKVTGGLLGGALLTGIIAYAITRPKTPDLDCPKIGKTAPLQLRCGVGADGRGAAIGCVGAF